MKSVPFYPNHADDLHCMLAVYQSILNYFYDEKLDWPELEKLTGFKPGKAAWSLKMITYLAERGMDIRMVEPFDYARYYRDGEPYLDELFSPEEKYWQLKNSNILDIKPLIPEFLEKVTYEMKRPTLNDIDNMLAEDRLVFVTLNLNTLNDKPGYTSHAVLIIADNGDQYVVHDPGLPPKPNRHVTKQKLYEAIGGEESASELTGFRLNKT